MAVSELIDLFDWALDGEPLTSEAERKEHGSRNCLTCGLPIERVLTIERRRRTYCSPECQRQEYNFQARCVECGEPCRKTRCQPCSSRRIARAQRKWTRDDHIAALTTWIEEHGKPPTWTEWTSAKMKPSGRLIQIEFGSWSAGIEAATTKAAPLSVENEAA